MFSFFKGKKKAEQNKESSDLDRELYEKTICNDDKKTDFSPLEHNNALFARFKMDLKFRQLPQIPPPTEAEITMCRQKRRGLESAYTSKVNTFIDMAKLQHNINEIPIEVEIWVDKVMDYYFHELIPVMGLCHQTANAEKLLYEYRGYSRFSANEIMPLVRFD